MMPDESPVSGAPGHGGPYPVSGGGYPAPGYQPQGPPGGYAPPGHPPPGYGQQPYAYPVSRPMNTMAIMSLVCAFVFFPLGILFGHIARKQIAQTGEDGATLAKVGIIVSWAHVGIYIVVTAILICWFIFLTSFAATIPTVTPS